MCFVRQLRTQESIYVTGQRERDESSQRRMEIIMISRSVFETVAVYFPVDRLSVYLWPLMICHIYKLVQPKKRCYQFCLNHFQKTGNKNPPRRQKPWMFWNIFFMFQLYISFSISCCDTNVRMCLCSGRVQDRNILLRVQKYGFSCPDSVRLIPPITKSFHLRVVCDPESKVINDVRRLTYVNCVTSIRCRTRVSVVTYFTQ